MDDATLRIAEEASQRDPRSAPFGIYSGGSFVLDGVRVFSWFRSLDELAEFLLETEPAIYGIEDEDLASYRKAVSPVLERFSTDGFTDELLAELNEAVKSDFTLEWWGRFDELVAGQSNFARNIVTGFLSQAEEWSEEQEDDPPVRALREDELDEFVEYLQTCGV